MEQQRGHAGARWAPQAIGSPITMADVLVPCYHAVSERWPAALSVTPAALDRQLGELVARGYRGARFADALGEPPHARTVVVSFSGLDRLMARHELIGAVHAPVSIRGSSWCAIATSRSPRAKRLTHCASACASSRDPPADR